MLFDYKKSEFLHYSASCSMLHFLESLCFGMSDMLLSYKKLQSSSFLDHTLNSCISFGPFLFPIYTSCLHLPPLLFTILTTWLLNHLLIQFLPSFVVHLLSLCVFAFVRACVRTLLFPASDSVLCCFVRLGLYHKFELQNPNHPHLTYLYK